MLCWSYLFSEMNPTLSQAITAETPITAEVWQTLMEQLNKVNQNNKLFKKAYKKKAQQNQALATKVRTSTKDAGTKENIN